MLGLTAAAEGATERLGLRYAALYWERRAISAEAQLKAAGTVAARWAAWRTEVASLLLDLSITEEARAQLERRHLDGRSSLFPDLAADWEVLRGQVEQLATLGGVVGAVVPRGSRARARPGRAAARAQLDLTHLRAVARDRAPAEAMALMDAARAAALDALGDADGAATIIESRLRAQ